MLSIAIPSRNEIFLKKTILDVLEKATGEIEVFPILDGYELPPEDIVDDPRVTYIRLPLGDGACHKRQGVNEMVKRCKGEFVSSLDAHCMMAKGFDEVLTRDCTDNMVMIPRRNRLDAENWSLQPQSDNRPPIDYEYYMCPARVGKNGLHGFKWDARTLSRADKMIDDNLTFQGSFWVMTKDHFLRNNFMQIEGYSGWGQEAEELGLTTWLNGGRVVTNKNTWYAHLHKGKKYGRMYFMSKESVSKCNSFSYNYWVNEHRDFFVELIKRFSPPGWSQDERKWGL